MLINFKNIFKIFKRLTFNSQTFHPNYPSINYTDYGIIPKFYINDDLQIIELSELEY